jgi:hypothetical protein
MSLEVPTQKASVIELLDHVLDKGIVIDAWLRVSLASIDLVTIEARVVVASIETYLANARTLGRSAPISRPVVTSARQPDHLRQHLLHVQEQLERRRFDRQQVRRFEDRVREERRDAHARTISH